MNEVGIPVNQQRLTLDGSILKDDHSLGDYNIMKDTVLHLVPLNCGNDMRIHVNTLSGKMITLEVVLEDSIEDVKKKICEEEGIPVQCQCLFYAGNELKDYRTLKDYNIERGSTLVLTREPMGDMSIFVKMLSGKTITLNVKPERDRMLRKYHIQNESTLHLRVDDQRGSMPVHVLMPSGNMTALDVLPNDDVQEIKLEIYDKDGIPPSQQYLLLDGNELEYGWTRVNIQKGSMLHLVLHQSVEKLNSSAGGPRAYKGQLKE